MKDIILYDNGTCKIALVYIYGFARYEVRPNNKNYGTCTVNRFSTAIDIAKRISKHEQKLIN